MKKLLMITAICASSLVFAQENAASEVQNEGPRKCECRRGPRDPRPEGCEKGPRAPRCPRGPRMASPRVKKCECSSECKGVIILPPNSTEGEELFKNEPPMKRGCDRRGSGEFKRGCGKCPRPGMRPPCGMRPEGGEGELPPPPPAPAAPEAPEAPVAE